MTGGARVGLEVHVYLDTRAKLFCACSARFLDAAANTQVCPVCTGQPGAKPLAPNAAAVHHGLRIAQGLGARILPGFRFQRKHYFYPDLPSNYQRTGTPLAVEGELQGVRIREMHVEEDPGSYDLAAGTVDYNRAGAPLLEIVTEPDITSPAHARAFLADLRLLLDHLGAGYAAAGVKADVNVSVAGGERAEVKNVNGFRNVETAVAYEVERQLAALARGERQVLETRGFDEATGRTSRLRVKETEADYRYMDDPDLPPCLLPEGLLQRVLLPEAPFARRARLAVRLGVAPEALNVLMEEGPLLDAYEALAAQVPPAVALEFLQRDVKGELHARRLRFAGSGLGAEALAPLLTALHARAIMPQVATRILREALDHGHPIPEAVALEAAARTGAEGALDEAVAAAIAENAKAVVDYRSGRPAALNFLVGAVMKRLRSRADPALVRARVEEALARLPPG